MTEVKYNNSTDNLTERKVLIWEQRKLSDSYNMNNPHPQIEIACGGGAGAGSIVMEQAQQQPMQQQAQQQPGWNGLTIREILEKVDLFNITVEEDGGEVIGKEGSGGGGGEKIKLGTGAMKQKEGKTVVSANDPEAAFLGPKIWDKPISLPPLLDDTEFSIMNIDDFLNENNISLDSTDPVMPAIPSKEASPEPTLTVNSSDLLRDKMEDMDMAGGSLLDEEQSSDEDEEEEEEMAMKISNKKATKRPASTPRNQLPKDTDNTFLYAESKRARMEREKEEKKRKLEVEFAPEDLALATIPGADFDPRRRAFSNDELRPQPIIRKRKKHYVPSESKDDKYWEKRVKNNFAARRSREARRLKENQIALRAAFLEKENNALRDQVEDISRDKARLVAEKKALMEKLKAYEEAARL